jgi:antitoxin VapB
MRMPLYIRDDEVAALARKVQGMSGAKTVTDAVREALQHEVARIRNDLPPSARLAKSLAMAQALGPLDPAFNAKAFSDEMWGDD